MPESLEELVMLQPPTAERPLLGTIVLVVEDSRHACEALRLICQRSGARIRRAESLASAERHLRTYRPRIAVIDLGLPDGSGLELIEKLSQADPRIDGIIATSGDETLQQAALDAGADVFLPKPLSSVSQFQNTALSLLPEGTRPRIVTRPFIDSVQPDPIALRDDLALASELLRTDPDRKTLEYVAGFLTGLAKSAGEAALASLGDAATALSREPAKSVTARSLAIAIEEHAATLDPV